MKILISDDLAFQKLPEDRATFYFSDGKSVIYAGFSSNLFARINRLNSAKENNEKIKEMWNTAKEFIFEVREKDIDCLVWYKSLIKAFTPRFNNGLNLWKNYTYMEINWNKLPFLSTKDSTVGEGIYIGPFRSRFFIHDIGQIFAKYGDLPSDNHEWNNLNQDQLDDIKNKTMKYYFSNNNDLAEKLDKEYHKFNDELEFKNAEEIKIEATLILKYYHYLEFLAHTKTLNDEIVIGERHYYIENGLLAEIKTNDSLDFREKNRSIEYMDKEKLAVNKIELDERWIVYNFWKNNRKIL